MRYSWRMGFLCAHPSWAGVLCAALLLSSMPAWAARKTAEPPPLLSASFRDTIERGIAGGAYRSLAVGLIEGDRRAAYYFGHRDGSTSKAPDEDSLFEAGTVSEVFTGLLLAQAAVDGKLRLLDPIEKFLPERFPFADPNTGKITLEQLATQRSGLPTQPANLFPSNLDDPYADYASEDLLALLAFRRMPADADANGYVYSVLNFGLLGQLLSRIYQIPYADLIASKIAAPLGLQRVSFTDDPGLLPGHTRGEATAHWHFGALGGAAGLRVGLPDLLVFLQRNLTPGDSPLRSALLLARQPRAAGSVDQVGLGWNVREKVAGEPTWPLVWRASRTGGFASFIGFRTDQQKAIVLLGNSSEDVASLGMAWLSGEQPPPPPRASTLGQINRLDEYPGLYRIAAGNEAVVRVTGDTLSLQLPGELPRRLHGADKDVFTADSEAVGVTFIRNIDEISGLVLRAGGSNISATRLSERAPRLKRIPIESGGAADAELRGDYRLDDGTWVRIASLAQGLTLQWTLGGRRSIFAYAPDRYVDVEGTVDLQIERDKSGRVAGIGFDLAGVRREALPVRRNSP